MKKLFLSILCAVCVWAVNAQTTYLRISQFDGTITKVAVSAIDSIDFVTEDAEQTPDEPTTPNFNGHAYVDLGLPSGTLWATCNVGATQPEEYGDYFAWGETTTKEDYSYATLKYWDNDTNTPTKYTGSNDVTTLEALDDAATVNWGGDWRMPTTEEQQELFYECTWNYISDYNNTGVAGCTFTSKKNPSKHIFLPAAGCYQAENGLIHEITYGGIWSSSLRKDAPSGAYLLYFNRNNAAWEYGFYSRYYGHPIRPVCSPAK